MKTFIASLVALGLFAGAANARPIDSFFTDLNRTSPKSVFDQLNESAPKSIFDQIRDSSPRSDGVFGTLELNAP